MTKFAFPIGTLLILLFVANSMGQIPPATEHHKILKLESGDWKATTRLFMGPEGPVDTPFESTGSEKSSMIGEFWLISDFDGNFGGMPFKGQGTFGYDEKLKKYVGTWIDSFSPHVTHMVGTYDKAKKTMTYETTGVGMDGKPSKGKNVVVYESEDVKKMVMFMTMPGSDELVKTMEIDYTRVKK